MGTTQLGLLEFCTVSKDKPIELIPWQFSIIVSHDESFNVFLWQVAATSSAAIVFISFHRSVETIKLWPWSGIRDSNSQHLLGGQGCFQLHQFRINKTLINSYFWLTVKCSFKKIAECVFQYNYYIIIYFKSQIFDFQISSKPLLVPSFLVLYPQSHRDLLPHKRATMEKGHAPRWAAFTESAISVYITPKGTLSTRGGWAIAFLRPRTAGSGVGHSALRWTTYHHRGHNNLLARLGRLELPHQLLDYSLFSKQLPYQIRLTTA